jgi:Ankyrin repeats (3 copies)
VFPNKADFPLLYCFEKKSVNFSLTIIIFPSTTLAARPQMKPLFSNRCVTHLPQEQEVLQLLYQEIKNTQNKFPSEKLRILIERSGKIDFTVFELKIPRFFFSLHSYSRDARRDLTKKEREGGHGCPLFYAAKLGNVHAVEYLVTNCCADLEQRNIFEVHEEKTFHYSTPLWVAAVANHLNVVKLLVRLGANMNAISDSGSTAVRSACFMTNVEVGELVGGSSAVKAVLSFLISGVCYFVVVLRT